MSTTEGLYTAVQRRTINQILKLATTADKGKIVKAFNLAEKLTPEAHKSEILFVRDKIIDDHPALNIAKHVVGQLSPRARDRFIECFVINTMLRGSAKRTEFTEREGVPTPFTILISPTMRCNLTCDGCFAGEYSRDSDMGIDTLQSIVDQANEMGVYLITILGGEPFFREDLLDFYAANPDVYFQVYTNGTLLDEATLDHLAALGNIAPMLSIEGGRELTDARRGPGIFDQIMKTMDGLRERGMVFGYSATVTRHNWQMLVSDEFADLMVDKGAMLCLELPLHAGRRRSRHEPHAHARPSATSSARASSACAAPRPCSRSTSGATRRTSRAASPASTTSTSTTRAGSSPASSPTSPPTTCTTSRSKRRSRRRSSRRSVAGSRSTTTCSCRAC